METYVRILMILPFFSSCTDNPIGRSLMHSQFCGTVNDVNSCVRGLMVASFSHCIGHCNGQGPCSTDAEDGEALLPGHQETHLLGFVLVRIRDSIRHTAKKNTSQRCECVGLHFTCFLYPVLVT